MSIVTPAPSASRGEVILQPIYFTSSLFVTALRDDITNLILAYHDQYTKTQPTQPFTLFKSLWSSQGWKWIHFMVFDSRTRPTFLDVVMRLFLERMVKTEAPYSRAVALFGLYTFFYTQPLNTAPPLQSIAHIPIQLDHYVSFKSLPNFFIADHLLPLRPAVSHIISTFLADRIFFVVPPSEFGALQPRDLPREIFVDETTVLPTELNAPKKRGRPTRRDKVKKAAAALNVLNEWLEAAPETATTGFSPRIPTKHTLDHYKSQKSDMLDAIYASPATPGERSSIEQANIFVLDRLKAAEELVSIDVFTASTERNLNAGLARAERATDAHDTYTEKRGGILSLLEGAGIMQTPL
ncbi:hypothetical protein BDZ94DRAFT_1309924 [Collybia nuda]|uniref:Uncharacterized protein n=1 Tax=Collybia nuda TaxID=64659 RepID=A0A9P6CDR7_9AGAR|nr:hypothetical protein BDZ94DRAFT_1309924 [Collybia nuda]